MAMNDGKCDKEFQFSIDDAIDKVLDILGG